MNFVYHDKVFLKGKSNEEKLKPRHKYRGNSKLNVHQMNIAQTGWVEESPCEGDPTG